MSSAPLRVLYFVSNYHRLTGSQRSLLLLLKGFRPDEVEPLVVFPGDGACTRAYRDASLRVIVEQAPPGIDSFGGALLRASVLERLSIANRALLPYSKRMYGLIRSERIQIVHGNNTRSTLMVGTAALAARVPRVWHVRSDERSMGIYRTACSAIANRIILVAHGIKSSVPAPFQHKCRVVHNGIDPSTKPAGRSRAELLSSVAPSASFGPDAVVCSTVGSLTPFKGAHHLIEAISRFQAEHPARRGDVHFVFVGDRAVEAYGRYLDELLARCRPINVHFAGWDDRPLDWIQASDVVILPTVERETLLLDGKDTVVSGTEGFSRTVLEAMSCSRPVIATRVAGVPEQVLDGETGLLVPPSDPAALAGAIAKLVADAEARVMLGARGREHVKEFSVRAMCERTLDVYRELASPSQ